MEPRHLPALQAANPLGLASRHGQAQKGCGQAYSHLCRAPPPPYVGFTGTLAPAGARARACLLAAISMLLGELWRRRRSALRLAFPSSRPLGLRGDRGGRARYDHWT